MNVCRLCGEEKSSLDFNVELNDQTASNWSYRELVEHHTRVALKSNKLLPQGVCEECRIQVDSFAEFSNSLQAIQNTFDAENDDCDLPIVTENFTRVHPILELIPETIIKEHETDESSDSNSELDDKSDRKHYKASQHEESSSYEEVFATELSSNEGKIFSLHLDVKKTSEYEKAVPESELTLLSTVRWINMVKDCEICDVPFRNLFEFIAHQESVHNTVPAPIPCKRCSRSFKKICSYINHVLNKHLNLEHLRFCCLACDLVFYSLVPLYRHSKLSHPLEHCRVFQCLRCGHHSESLEQLKKHKRRVHDNDEETEVFIKLYTSLEDQGHKMTFPIDDCYKNQDGSVSTECGKVFKLWNDFKMNCTICPQADLSPIEYFLHHQNEHMDSSSTTIPQTIKFSCINCPEEDLPSLVDFHSHILQKHDNRHLSFQCIVCAKLFWNYGTYSYHMKFFHPTLRQFSCLLCGKMLDRFTLFRHHLTASHPTEMSVFNKRRPEQKVKSKSIDNQKSKRSKLENFSVKQESESDIDSNSLESDETSEGSSDGVQVKQKCRTKKSKRTKSEAPKRRPNNRHRPEKQTLFGPELNTPEKLYAQEIKNVSKFPAVLHLNISIQERLPNGEVPENLAQSQGVNPLRWRDLLVCAVCKVKFTNILVLTEHIAKNHGSRTRAFGCFNCEIEYGALYESSLVNHLVERHYYEHLKLCCLVCSKLFYDFISLVNHYKTHGGRFQILVCFICGFYAKTLDDLKEHKAYHVQMENSKPDNQMLCERVLEKYNKDAEPNTFFMDIADYERNPDGTVTMECQQRFTVDWSFAQYQCPLCLVGHQNPFELFAHLRLKHPKEQEQTRKIYSCNTCVEKREFSGMHYFINHAAEFHFKSLRFTCVVCSRLFWNYLALANHYKNIHPSFTAVFCCHCGKLFHSITSGAIHYKKIMILLTDEEKKLKREGKLETEESSHICHVCGKSCKNNYTLVKHITTHEEPDPSKMLQCHVCSKLFNTKNKLAQHMVGHNNLRKWKCKICGMSFNFKKLLQMHTRAVHENERSFACTFCEKRFFKKYDLTVHVRLHTGDFPYACPVSDCDAKYPAWSNLFKHCQSRHKLDIRSEGYKKLRASEKANQNEDFLSE